MKKSLSVLLCLLLCLSIFAGCVPEENPKIEETVEISGVWKFAVSVNKWKYTEDTLFKSREKRVATVSFTANGQAFSSMSWDYLVQSMSGAVSLRFDETQVYGGAVIQGTTYADPGSWEDVNYMTIDFGAKPQTVSKDFYNWLAANASPIT